MAAGERASSNYCCALHLHFSEGFYEERVVWKALGLKSLVDNALAPCLPKGLAIRVLIAKCLWNVCILLVVMMVLTSSSFHFKKGRFWYLF